MGGEIIYQLDLKKERVWRWIMQELDSKLIRVGARELRIQVSVLKNGVVVCSLRNNAIKGVTLGIGVRDGIYHEARRLAGIRHAIEHFVLCGSENTGEATLYRGIEYAAGSLVAETTREYVLYRLRSPTWQEAQKSFSILTDVFLHPKFDPDELELERQILMVERNSDNDSNEQLIEELLFKMLSPETNMGFSIDGTIETIQNYTRNDILSTYQRRYTPRRITVLGVGKLHHEELLRLAKKLFGDLPRKHINPSIPRPEVYKGGRRERKVERPSHRSSMFGVGFDISSIRSSLDDQSAFSLLLTILATGSASRLWEALRIKRGIGYTIDCSEQLVESRHATAFITLDCLRSSLPHIEGIICDEIEKVKLKGISWQELRGAGKILRRNIREEIDDADSLCNILYQELLAGAPDNVGGAHKRLGSLKPDDIQRVAQEYLDLGNYAVVQLIGLAENEREIT